MSAYYSFKLDKMFHISKAFQPFTFMNFWLAESLHIGQNYISEN